MDELLKWEINLIKGWAIGEIPTLFVLESEWSTYDDVRLKFFVYYEGNMFNVTRGIEYLTPELDESFDNWLKIDRRKAPEHLQSMRSHLESLYDPLQGHLENGEQVHWEGLFNNWAYLY